MSPFSLAALCVSAAYGWMAWRMRSVSPQSFWLRLGLPATLLAHGALLYVSVLGEGDIRLGFGNSVSTVFWLAALMYWASSHGAPLARVQSWVTGLASAGTLFLAIFTAAHVIPNSQMLALRAHLAVSFLAYGLLAVAALHALLMTILEKQLHRGAVAVGAAPPLLTLEAILFRTIGAGFVLLTLVVSSGILFSEELFGQPLQLTHKVVFGILSWLVFGGLLLGRHFRGWRGRTALWWTITGFTLLLMAYVGTQFVLEVVLGR
ncbi:transmembrane protein [Thiobacillus denitrificans ATCC 25259]|uniref:Transmembrane protein n=1 Tax=Thiobacillus denitrificans (strain ATCC 25259 / T1) TaxID=292415 RepID=Q3SGC5_THIDA|nr:cytochrome c biogenesis protein CcsA [Thiobacillus denitrificans]AAZ98325.1 transmembrane protein [Thiobacillus denitrificans ATCC 25259]